MVDFLNKEGGFKSNPTSRFNSLWLARLLNENFSRSPRLLATEPLVPANSLKLSENMIVVNVLPRIASLSIDLHCE